MILIGHPYIPFAAFEKITSIDDVAHTSVQATVVCDFGKEQVALCHYLRENAVTFALYVEGVKDVVLASALGASFIICDKSLVEEAQKIADDYLFDAKILLQSDDEADIVYAAKKSIDGILFDKGVKHGSR